MKKETYLQKRGELMNQAQQLLDAGDTEKFEDVTKQIEKLDNEYEESSKRQANLDALKDRVAGPDFAAAAVNPQFGNVVGRYEQGAPDDMYDSAEYKAAFQAYVCRGVPIPAKFSNVDQNTKTSDASVVIPTTTVQKIYEAMERVGNILPLVTRTNFAGGMSVPTSSVKPTATWVAEGAGSDTQKKTVSYISFSYHKLRCAVRVSYEMDNMAYGFFEAQLAQNVAEAIVKAEETAIFKGTGSGQPKGFLTEIATGNINIANTKHISYADLCKAEGLEEDDEAIWVMTKATFMNEIQGMVDTDGQPVARVNYGLNGKPEYYIFGRRVEIVNKAYMDDANPNPTADTICAALYNFRNYIFNSGVALRFRRYTDNKTDDEVTVAIEVCDGMSVQNQSLITLTNKKAAGG